MKILILYDYGNFGRDFRLSLHLGLGNDKNTPKISGEHRIENKEDLDKVIDNLKELPDLIIGPNTSSLVSHLLTYSKIAKIPVISTQATSTHLPNLRTNYFQLAASDEHRIKLLLNQISSLYNKNRDLYLFTKKDDEGSYSSNLRKEIIKQYLDKASQFKNHILHDEIFEIEVAHVSTTSDGTEITKKITRNINLNQNLKIDYKYPIVICAESMASVYLVKYLRDQGYMNKIFAFGTNQNMFKRTMMDAYLVSNEDDEFSNSSKKREAFREDKVTIDFGNHLRNYENLNVGALEKYSNQIIDSYKTLPINDLPIAVRRIQKNQKTKIVGWWDNTKLKFSLFTGSIINNSKLIGVYLGFFTVLIGVIAIIVRVIWWGN